MARTGFLPISEAERLLRFTPPKAREIVLEMRNVIAAACPHATESVLWGTLSYHDATKGGRVKGAICNLEYRRFPVRVSFIHGVRLSDPERLLRGTRLSKRYLDIYSFDEAPWGAIRRLVEGAASFDPSVFAPIARKRITSK